jgi:cysteinyl-tRNA synthetase
VVSIWVHGGFLQMEGQKMAKSAKNIKRVTDLADNGIDPLAYRLQLFGTRYRSEMDFDWAALEGSNERLATLRRRMLDWSAEARPDAPSESGAAFDGRFRDALADDLDLPAALVVLNELVGSPEVSGGEKYQLLASWDAVLGLDVERLVREGWEPSEEIRDLVRKRDEARAGKDYTASDDIRRQLIAMGLEVMDTPEGTRVRPSR